MDGKPATKRKAFKRKHQYQEREEVVTRKWRNSKKITCFSAKLQRKLNIYPARTEDSMKITTRQKMRMKTNMKHYAIQL